MSRRITVLVGVTGASGSIYAIRLIRHMAAAGVEVHLVASQGAIRTIALEVDEQVARNGLRNATRFFDDDDLAAPPATSACHYDAHVVIPCSVNTVGCVHSGIANTLLLRSCAVALKERRKLVLVPRELPVSAITLQQLADLAKLGCDVCFAAPGFYGRPATVDDLVDFVCFKVMSLISVPCEQREQLRDAYLRTVELCRFEAPECA